MASLDDILTTQQSGVQVLSALQTTQAQSVPSFTSGHLAANKLIQAGFVRVLGISVVDGSVSGNLHDAAALADAGAANAIYVIPTTKGFYPVNMIFQNGLVMMIGTDTKVAIFYSRV